MNKIQFNCKSIAQSRWWLSAALFLMLCLSPGLQAQVSIGDGGTGVAVQPQDFSVLELISNKSGLRLPHLTTGERDALRNSDAFKGQLVDKAKAVTIFNTTTNCVDYWNGQKWISLCQGTSSFTGGTCVDTPVGVIGGSVNCAIVDPDCKALGSYTFSLIQGSEYSNLTVLDAGAGKFDLVFSENNWATDRQAILLVTSPCGTSSIFVFTQKGDGADCDVTSVPNIKAVNTTSLCAGGAVYLYVEGYPTDRTFIWTLNGQVIGGGNKQTVTRPGKYIVYGEKLGCTNKSEVTVSYSPTFAPDPVSVIVLGNNGMACGANGTVKLVSSTPAAGTVVWYKDGQRTGLTGTQIDANKGYWQAVVENGGCSSTISEGVTVFENLDGGSVPQPEMLINGVPSGWSFCKGGSVFLEIAGTPTAGITYTWYADNTVIGTGSGIYYKIPDSEKIVIRLRATGVGCAKEALAVAPITTGTIPPVPFISCNTPGKVLCGGEAILTASANGASEYRWFKDGVEIPGKTTASLTINATGSYTATAISAGCMSIQSGAIVIGTSDYATISWVSKPTENLLLSTKKTYSVSLDFPQNATYTWAVDSPSGTAVITNGQGTASVILQLSSVAEFITLTCTATNACGSVIESPISIPLEVKVGCANASIKNPTAATSVNVKENKKTTLSVIATGNPSLTYQWYKGLVSQGAAGTAIPGATGGSYEYTADEGQGTKLFYCIVTVGGGCQPATSPQFTVNVTVDPATVDKGTGSISGLSCFDIASDANDDKNSCGAKSQRVLRKADFSNRTSQDKGAVAPYSGVQVYTFTPVGTVSDVHFDYVDNSGKVVESITPQADYTGNNISSPCKVTVAYKTSLNEDLVGLTTANALKVTLYAVYNNGPTKNGAVVAVNMTASFQDCACCGSNGAAGQILVGANTYLTHLYGEKCWMVSNSKEGTPSAKTYSGQTEGKNGYYYTQAKAQTACPQGWHLPSCDEMTDLVSQVTANKSVSGKWWNEAASNAFAGLLYCPENPGCGTPYSNFGRVGYWWSSTFQCVVASSSNLAKETQDVRFGYSVRCVQDN